ncbi:MAG TPA: alkaline phosphatase family protein [Candidatus Acidoferrum sp.]|nr:alkaline phosphatase family protein [Candidatus Acidoferrum sp.]
MAHWFTRTLAGVAAAAIALFPVQPAFAQGGSTATPIKHIVVIFQENVSFDHYFGTYPNATNPTGEPAFYGKPNTPVVNGLGPALLTKNPNLNPANGTGAANPFRLDRSQAVTRDQGHGYKQEQQAFDNGLMDLFPSTVGRADVPPAGGGILNTTALNLGYFDGNTVTALWNYAQHFAMNDNSFSSTFGPSTPGLLNLVSGQTNGAINLAPTLFPGAVVDGGSGSFSVISDPDPLGDTCSNAAITISMKGQNIGDLLEAAGVSWGSFMGGFNLQTVNPDGSAGCARTSTGLSGKTKDYIPHHAFFQYSATTSNLKHTRPLSVSEIGHDGPANHNYDIVDFFAAVSAGNFPAVSILKAPAFQDGHAGYSNPLDEQNFIVGVLNFLQTQPEWASTAVVIMYDDSDGWYDHQMSPIVNQSQGAQDALSGAGLCGASATSTALPGVDPANTHALGRCGYGPRQPFLIVSPWARKNFVDHSITDQSSVIRFIEDNWLGGQRIGQGSFDAIAGPINGMFDFSQQGNQNQGNPLILDPSTGTVLNQQNQQ